jgi:hypothetical protein
MLIFCGMPAPECVVLAQVLDPLAVDEMAEYGTAVAAGEDLDGDGQGDLVVAAPFPESGGISDSGRVYVHRGTGSRAGFQREPAWLLRGTHPRDRFGGSLALLRDFDGDQRVDLAIGAPGWCGLHLGEGSVVVVSARFMASGPIDALPHLKLHGGVPGAAFGRRLVAAGDLDGDGLSDLAASTVEVGAHLPDKAGRLEVVYGGQVDLGADVQFAIRYPGAAVFPDPTVSEASLVRAGSEGRLGLVGGLTGAAGLAEPETRSAGRARGVLPAGPAVLLAAGAACGLAGIGSLGWWGWSRLRVRIRDGERQRISRDLHDELGAQLDRLKAVGTESGREAVAPDVAREVSVGIERVIWSLDPGRRTWSDLACGLADLAEGILGDTPVRCRFEFPERPPAEELPPNTLEALYRVTQEALNNVRKHSFAGHAWVRLAWEPSGLRLEIEDDGVGLRGSEDGNGVPARNGSGGSVPAAGMGRGLEQMTARIREVGGTCRWEASEPTGVRVVVTVPRR